ncbi:hypothetical protein HS041_05975 [Planomonospora sp. ID67723]|uniref:hypothetical protein n=1 Tax=Planomonospora sp. ID67723 TaxID=2738134 RepID=UPI0018C43EFA|nr:hypothetical protein [Planomonospora sp. ID67723]MBG0827308.1 hypothetical protein [Planomonospora sp. ID67723]
MRRIATPLLTGTLLLAMGCGTGSVTAPSAGPGSTATETGPSQPVSHTVPPRVEPTQGPKPTKPTGDADNPRKIRWLTAKPSKDRRSLRVVWWSGVEPCHVLDRVAVKETARKVTVTLWEGPSSKVQNVACIEIAIQKVTTVKLKKPLGARKVVDGARR